MVRRWYLPVAGDINIKLGDMKWVRVLCVGMMVLTMSQQIVCSTESNKWWSVTGGRAVSFSISILLNTNQTLHNYSIQLGQVWMGFGLKSFSGKNPRLVRYTSSIMKMINDSVASRTLVIFRVLSLLPVASILPSGDQLDNWKLISNKTNRKKNVTKINCLLQGYEHRGLKAELKEVLIVES